MDSLIDIMLNVLNGLNKDVTLFIISMIPILELRGGIVAASVLGVPYFRALAICIIGNVIPIPFILLFINKIFEWLKSFKLTRGIVEKMEYRAMSKSDTIKKYEFLGLLLFVGIPLPGTGAWTGALVAALLRVKLKKAVPAIFSGILLASCIMSFIAYGIPYLVKQI